MKRNKHLYDANIQVFITNKENFHKGANRINTLWNLDSKEKQELHLIRGVRYIKLDECESNTFKKTIENHSDAIICVIIRGTDENGFTYSAIKKYASTDIMNGYMFVSIRESECYSQASVPTESNKKEKKRRKAKEFKKRFRYHHFNKLLQINEETPPDSLNKDILSPSQVVNGQYRGIRRIFYNLLNYIFSKVLG